MINPGYLGTAFLGSEVLLSTMRRSRGTGVRQDRSTLRILWLVIAGSVGAAIYITLHHRGASLPFAKFFGWLGFGLFVLGLVVRWWAIIALGRFFTVDVQIEPDHDLVQRGPYRLVRHPSYSGVLLAFFGFGLTLGNWAALLALMVPLWFAFGYRMRVEEEALSGALGEGYRSYQRRTKRLIPGVY